MATKEQIELAYLCGTYGSSPPDFILDSYNPVNPKADLFMPENKKLIKAYSRGIEQYCLDHNIDEPLYPFYVKSLEDFLGQSYRILGFNSGIRLELPPKMPSGLLKTAEDCFLLDHKNGYIAGFIIGVNRAFKVHMKRDSVPLRKSKFQEFFERVNSKHQLQVVSAQL